MIKPSWIAPPPKKKKEGSLICVYYQYCKKQLFSNGTSFSKVGGGGLTPKMMLKGKQKTSK